MINIEYFKNISNQLIYDLSVKFNIVLFIYALVIILTGFSFLFLIISLILKRKQKANTFFKVLTIILSILTLLNFIIYCIVNYNFLKSFGTTKIDANNNTVFYFGEFFITSSEGYLIKSFDIFEFLFFRLAFLNSNDIILNHGFIDVFIKLIPYIIISIIPYVLLVNYISSLILVIYYKKHKVLYSIFLPISIILFWISSLVLIHFTKLTTLTYLNAIAQYTNYADPSLGYTLSEIYVNKIITFLFSILVLIPLTIVLTSIIYIIKCRKQFKFLITWICALIYSFIHFIAFLPLVSFISYYEIQYNVLAFTSINLLEYSYEFLCIIPIVNLAILCIISFISFVIMLLVTIINCNKKIARIFLIILTSVLFIIFLILLFIVFIMLLILFSYFY